MPSCGIASRTQAACKSKMAQPQCLLLQAVKALQFRLQTFHDPHKANEQAQDNESPRLLCRNLGQLQAPTPVLLFVSDSLETCTAEQELVEK